MFYYIGSTLNYYDIRMFFIILIILHDAYNDLPCSSISIVILGYVTGTPSTFTTPPVIINHTHCSPIIWIDRE